MAFQARSAGVHWAEATQKSPLPSTLTAVRPSRGTSTPSCCSRMPVAAFPYRRFDEDFVAEIRTAGGAEPPTNTIARALDRDRYGSGHRTRDPADALREFGEECIQHVLTFGEAAYELVFWRAADEEAWSSFDLGTGAPLLAAFRSASPLHRRRRLREAGRAGQIPAQSVILFRLRPDGRRREVATAVALLQKANVQSARVMQACMARSPEHRHLLAELSASSWLGRRGRSAGRGVTYS